MRETHVLIALYEVHFEPKEGDGQALDMHEHKAMRDWMIDEVHRRLEDRPEIHIQFGGRVGSDPQSWQDRCRTMARRSYLCFVHIVLAFCLVYVIITGDKARDCARKCRDLIKWKKSLVELFQELLSAAKCLAKANHELDSENDKNKSEIVRLKKEVADLEALWSPPPSRP